MRKYPNVNSAHQSLDRRPRKSVMMSGVRTKRIASKKRAHVRKNNHPSPMMDGMHMAANTIACGVVIYLSKQNVQDDDPSRSAALKSMRRLTCSHSPAATEVFLLPFS